MAQGTVKWFNDQKKFGFISRAEGNDVFVHASSLRDDLFTLNEGDMVEFEVVEGQKGPKADNVTKINWILSSVFKTYNSVHKFL